MARRLVYMDHNATTPLHPEVKKAITHALEVFGNASSFHQFGREARNYIETAREELASFIGARPDEIVFMGSGSEANNTVLEIFSCSSKICEARHGGRRDIVTSTIEHPCILGTTECLEGRGMKVSYAAVDKYGQIDLEQLDNLISDRTGIVTIMTANNEIGTIQDIKKIAQIAHKHGSLVHTDAVQAVGKIPVNVNELGVDFLSLSAHKIYGPKGVGALYVKTGTPYCPLIRGGHQEKGRRAGTENTLGIIGLGKAVEMLKKEMGPGAKKLLQLKSKLKEGIEKNISDVRLNGHPTESLPGTLNVSFEGCEGEAILLYLDLEGIGVSTGSACSSGSLDPSHVLLATGLEAERAHGSIRFSLGRDSSERDIDYVVDKLKAVIEKVRKMSSAYPEVNNG